MANLADLTHDELDALAEREGVPDEDYPTSGNKDAKVDALTAAGVTAPADGPADDTATSDAEDAPPEPDDEDAPEHQRAVNRGRTGLDPTLAAARDATREAEGDGRPPRAGARTVDVVDPNGRLEDARAEARRIEGRTVDVREGTAEA